MVKQTDVTTLELY